MRKLIMITLLFFVRSPYCLVQLNKRIYEYKVHNYLIEEIKYTDEDNNQSNASGI
ncbi:hypothetical protein [Lysinibacillus sp. JNUCC-52]|uniref:hypothetical protein n=1 Tax=Lysinibacillus sp. JNUCC-52 TaxID=2792480 RepID=UPI001935CE95|nr:hypothetical protein JNUCC52_01690 [Lysinibacillus sp. JNUCC-52]